MCRILAYLSIEKPIPRRLVEEFIEVAKLFNQCDGWGVAVYDESGSVKLYRDVSPIWEVGVDRVYSLVKDYRQVLLHVRKASPGLPVSLRNTQPFKYLRYAFAHNGEVDILKLPAPKRLVPFGETDSEHVFCLLIETIEEVGDVERAFVKWFENVKHAAKALNTVLTYPGKMLVSNYFVTAPATRPWWYIMHIARSEKTVIVSSSELKCVSGWERISEKLGEAKLLKCGVSGDKIVVNYL